MDGVPKQLFLKFLYLSLMLKPLRRELNLDLWKMETIPRIALLLGPTVITNPIPLLEK